tara:strand:+ start:51 stop:368 length:318 start_codon:yes stop_codon:yes gene_type:complete
MYSQATDDIGRTFDKGDYVEIRGLNEGNHKLQFRGIKGYIYDVDWSEPRVTHTERLGLYLRGGWDMTLVDAPDAKPETGLVTRWKQGEDGGQVTLIEKRVIQEKI